MESDSGLLGQTSIINPLALPKGTEKFCELCDRVAYLKCTACGVTYYCDAEHQQADWVGIHKRICQLLIPLRGEASFNQTPLKQKKAELIEICKLEAQKKLSMGKHQEALPAARFSLSCSIDLHGTGTLELVPPYLLLAEANMGLGSFNVAKELLYQAKWVVSKNPGCASEVHHWMHRNMGRFHVLSKNFEAARFQFANDIYHACEQYGLDSMATTTGFFLLADVFAKERKMPVTCSLYSEVARRCHKHLDKLFQSHMQGLDKQSDSKHEKSQRMELDEMLRTMLKFVQKQLKRDMAQTALVAHCLALLWFLEGNLSKAQGYGKVALEASQRIQDHDLAKPIQDLVQLVKSRQGDTQLGSDESSHAS